MEIDISPIRDAIRASQHDEEEGGVPLTGEAKAKSSSSHKLECLRLNEWNFPCCHVRCAEFSASAITWNCAIGATLTCGGVMVAVVINQLANAAFGC